MGRWEPDARGRLLHAAVDLFSEHGYEATTAAQIAERAGLTKTTLFRHFADKREILFQGQGMLVDLVAEAVAAAPADLGPFDLLRAAVHALCAPYGEERRELGRRIDVMLVDSSELRERAVYKRSAITDALRGALAPRLGDARRAGLLADAGIRAFYDGFAAWILRSDDTPLAEIVDDELRAYAPLLALP